jgi:hypothetical protein
MFGIRHQFPSKFTEILHVGCLFGRNNEAEVMAISPASLGERVLVGGL